MQAVRFLFHTPDYWKNSQSTTHTTVNVPEWEWDLSDPFSVPASPVVPPSVPCPPVAPPIDDDPVPPVSTCEVNVAPLVPDCGDCIPGILVLPI